MEEILSEVREDIPSKTWKYSEKTNKHTTHHTITVTKQRFTHEAQIKEAAQAMRQRTDISLKDVNSVSTYYGLSRNLIGTIILGLLAVLVLIVSFGNLSSGEGGVGIGVFCLIIAAGFAALAYLSYKKIKPTFVLEIETVVRNGIVQQHGLSYGNASINLGKKKHSLLFYAILILIWPLGVVYLLSRKKGGKYKFDMDPAVGNEIVDTIGPFLMD